MNQSLDDGYWREFPIQSRRSGIRKVKKIKGLRGGVHLVRRTSDPADLSASGGLVSLRLIDADLPASGRDCGKGPFMDGN